MSDDWLQSKLQAEPCFMLEFTDKHQLLMPRTKLEALCNALPALPLLLFGHPSMKEKVADRRSDNGIMVLRLMGVDLSLERFLPMMNIVLEIVHLPAEESAIADLLATVNLLGGCDRIENEIRMQKRPRCPEQDVNDEFEWKQLALTTSPEMFHLIGESCQKWFDQGWTSVDDISVSTLPRGNICTNLLRRPK